MAQYKSVLIDWLIVVTRLHQRHRYRCMWLITPCHPQWNISHWPSALHAFHFYVPPCCTCTPAVHILARGLISRRSVVAVFFCNIAVSTVVLATCLIIVEHYNNCHAIWYNEERHERIGRQMYQVPVNQLHIIRSVAQTVKCWRNIVSIDWTIGTIIPTTLK